jgi:hypothetical protein
LLSAATLRRLTHGGHTVIDCVSLLSAVARRQYQRHLVTRDTDEEEGCSARTFSASSSAVGAVGGAVPHKSLTDSHTLCRLSPLSERTVAALSQGNSAAFGGSSRDAIRSMTASGTCTPAQLPLFQLEQRVGHCWRAALGAHRRVSRCRTWSAVARVSLRACASVVLSSTYSVTNAAPSASAFHKLAPSERVHGRRRDHSTRMRALAG